MDRLQKWAVSRGLIDSFTGPFETVNRMIRLVENMERTIGNKEGRIDHLTEQLRMLRLSGDSNSVVGKARSPVGQLQEESQ
jgi:hypothetical protein